MAAPDLVKLTALIDDAKCFVLVRQHRWPEGQPTQSALRRQLDGAPAGTWLAQMLSRMPRLLVVVALANKMARTVWALLAKGETYRSPTVAASS